MFCVLTTTSAATSAALQNTRWSDVIKLLCGETNLSNLNATAWDLSQCRLTTEMVGNWSVVGANFPNFGTTDSWTVILTKPSTAPTKQIYFALSKVNGDCLLQTCLFNTVATDISSGYSLGDIGAANTRFIVASNKSSILVHRIGKSIVFGVERTYCLDYDTSSLESLGLVVSITDTMNSGLQFSRLYNPQTKQYTTFTPNRKIDQSNMGIVGISRDENGLFVLPLVPLFCESWENGWAGGDLSKNSGIWRTCDNYAFDGYSVVNRTNKITILAIGELRYILVEK